MGFLGVYKAIYDYAPQSEGELAISDGDVLYVLEKSDEDDWWKVKKKASAEEDDEPTGLIPNNYIEEAPAVGHARALYEYTRQTDEELSFPEDAQLEVFDTSDPDWILVGLDGDYGFVPANYIEMGEAAGHDEPEPAPQPVAPAPPPALPTRPVAPVEPEPEPEPEPEIQSPPLPARQPSITSNTSSPPASTPATTLAGVVQGRSSTRAATPPPIAVPPPRQQYFSDESADEPSPALPQRPRSHSNDYHSNELPLPSPPQRTSSRRHSKIDYHNAIPGVSTGKVAPGGFHMYNINEMVSVMGKKKKMPTTLGVNLKTGLILIAPERSHDGPTQEWSGDKMTHYSREGKHVFLELVRPSRSIDFHAGAKDTAEEIVSALAELSGAVKAEGLREVIAAGTGQNIPKKGVVLYDFMAQGEDEVTVAVGDEVMIVDDAKSDEWWQVRRIKNGEEGVVPSSYIEVTETVKSSSTAGVNAGRSTVAQNRLEEERLFKEALKKDQREAERSKRENGRADGSRSLSKPKPDATKVRVWTDRSKSFSVEAQFLGIKDGKINLHKVNGVKIAVPIAKMSVKDLEYVELITGISLDEDKPLSDVKRAKSSRVPSSKVGASIEKPEYDWFQFFLSCEVAVGLCERYAQAFNKDSMDESILPHVDATVLRTLGLREGDIIKVMLHLDKKYGRDVKKRNVSFAGDDEDNGPGGLFSGPGGTLRNNTRKARPAPAVETNDTIDAKTFSQKKDSGADTPSTAARPKANDKSAGGFDDDAWDVKPLKQPEAQPNPALAAETKAPSPPALQPAPPTQAMLDLSLLSKPLEPVKAQPTPPPQIIQPPPQPVQQQPPQPVAAQPTGATPGFFTSLAQQQTGLQFIPTGQVAPLNLGLGNRQRPLAPQMTQGSGALIPPPPARPLSAPQSAQPSGFAPPPLQPQMTGIASQGQSLNDLSQQRMQQQYMGNFQAQPTGQSSMTGFNLGAGIQAQPTSFSQFMQPQMTGAPQMQQQQQHQQQSPFADPRPQQQQQFQPIQNQPTGFSGGFNPGQQFPQPIQNQSTGINSFLPSAMEPQRTGMPPVQSGIQPQQTGFGSGFGQGFQAGTNNQQQTPIAPLQPQQTGPAPPVRFGVGDKIAPQATGRRANLAQATPQNPFGF